MKRIIAITTFLFLSLTASAQYLTRHSMSYEAGITMNKDFSEFVSFNHTLQYIYWFKSFLGINTALGCDFPGTGSPDLHGYCSYKGHPAKWKASLFPKFAISAGITLATPMLKLKDNTSLCMFIEPEMIIKLPVAFANTTIEYNGLVESKTIKANSGLIAGEIKTGITLKFERFSISPGYSISLYDRYAGERKMKIGDSVMTDFLPQYKGFNHRIFLRFTIHEDIQK